MNEMKPILSPKLVSNYTTVKTFTFCGAIHKWRHSKNWGLIPPLLLLLMSLSVTISISKIPTPTFSDFTGFVFFSDSCGVAICTIVVLPVFFFIVEAQPLAALYHCDFDSIFFRACGAAARLFWFFPYRDATCGGPVLSWFFGQFLIVPAAQLSYQCYLASFLLAN